LGDASWAAVRATQGVANGLAGTRRVFAEMGRPRRRRARTNSHTARICRNGGSCGGAAHGLTVTRRVFAEMAPAVECGQARGPSPPRFGRPADDFAPPGGGLFFRFTVVEAGFECFVAAGLAPDLAADVELVPCPVSLTPRR